MIPHVALDMLSAINNSPFNVLPMFIVSIAICPTRVAKAVLKQSIYHRSAERAAAGRHFRVGFRDFLTPERVRSERERARSAWERSG